MSRARLRATFIIVLFPAVVAFWYLLGDFFAKTAASDASKARAALMNQVDRFAFDLELELSLLDSYLMAGDSLRIDRDYRSFSSSPYVKEALASYALAARWPALVSAVYLVEKSADSLSTVRVLPDDDRPDAYRVGVEAIYATILDGEYQGRVASSGLMTRAVWLRGFRHGATKTRLLVAVLDESLMVEGIVPKLAARYFGDGSGFSDYLVSVIDPTGRVRYASDPQSGGEPDFSRPLIRDNSRFDIARFYAAFAPKEGEAPMEPEERRRLSLPPLPKPGAPRPVMSDAPFVIDRYRFQSYAPGDEWSVNVYGRPESIEAAAARQYRSWWIASAGFLAILYGSIVTLYVSSRRASELASRERDFVASVTHELKTPIAVALSAGENLAKGIVPQERVGSYGAVVADEARRLADSVERLLVMANIESSPSLRSGERASVSELVDSVARKLSYALAQRGAELRLLGGGDLTIEGSRVFIESALECVMANAVMYAGGLIRVEAKEEGQGARRRVVVSCTDQGPGVPWRERRRIFEPFYRGSAASSGAVRGTGIGLYLARRIARLHGGDAVAHFPGDGGLVIELGFRSYQ